ncbi:MAG: AAA family ATPase [Pseudomonadota bacterium]
MLNYLNIRNFRAFRGQQFDFSKINIFMGPNNSGKSSALSAINLLAQTIQSRHLSPGPLLLNGPYEELGTYIDAVHGNHPRSVLGFDFGIGNYHVSFDTKYRTQRREIELSKFALRDQTKPVYSYQLRRSGYEVRLKGQLIENVLPNAQKRKPTLNGFWPWDQSIRFPVMADDESAESRKGRLLRELSRSMRMAERSLLDQFRNFDTLSPFREKPDRTYMYTGQVPTSIGRTGANGISLIVNDSSKRGAQRVGILDEINTFFQVTGIAKGIKVRNLTSRHYEICLVDHDGLEHNICDVGFGCSQVLPVLVSGLHLFLSSKAYTRRFPPMLVVQEPEIHLHPNAQAALGSFFVGLSNYKGQLFIETHSDHLVIRIARHVARGDIKAEDVVIYYIYDDDGTRNVSKMSFDDRGAFKPEWPGGFLPHRRSESLALAHDRNEAKSVENQMVFPYLDS